MIPGEATKGSAAERRTLIRGRKRAKNFNLFSRRQRAFRQARQFRAWRTTPLAAASRRRRPRGRGATSLSARPGAAISDAAISVTAGPAAAPALPAEEARARGETLLQACMARRAEDAVRLIVEGADLDVADRHGGTPLLWASGEGLEADAKRLAEVGVELDHAAAALALGGASAKGRISVVQLLADRGARLDLAGADGFTALSLAAFSGQGAAAKLLAARMDAAALNLKNEEGETALNSPTRAEATRTRWRSSRPWPPPSARAAACLPPISRRARSSSAK